MNFLSSLAPHVHWGLRASLAATFIYHGVDKFPIEPMMGMPVAIVWLLALGEIAAGVMLIAGGAFGKELLTRLGGLIVIVVMVGAIALFHGAKGFNVMQQGMEFQLLMLVTGLYFAARGNDV